MKTHINESQIEVIRSRRNKMLSDTDWTQFADSPLSDEKKEAFKVYRQQLRDMTKTYQETGQINWPEEPAS